VTYAISATTATVAHGYPMVSASSVSHAAT
jgi:hypothetical protein